LSGFGGKRTGGAGVLNAENGVSRKKRKRQEIPNTVLSPRTEKEKAHNGMKIRGCKKRVDQNSDTKRYKAKVKLPPAGTVTTFYNF